MYRIVMIAGVLAAMTIPAAAQTSTTTTTTTGTSTSTEFYVVQDVATKKCTIVDKKPTTTSMVQVGPVAFKSRTEAEAGMSSVKVCTTN
jgi:hypothetical protein